MAYIGPAPKLGQNREVDDISSGFNGSTTAFTLQVGGSNASPGSANNIIVSVNNVVLNPNTAYTVNGSTITFTTPPTNGHAFFGLILGQGIDTSSPADGSVTTAKLGDDAVTAAKIANTSVTAGSYTTADLTVDAQGRITAASNGNISSAEIADNAVTTAKINADAVTNAKIAAGAISATELDSNAVTTAKIAADAVTNAKLADNCIATEQIADDAVTSSKLADNAVVTAAINAAAVTSSKLADSAVTTAKISDGTISTAKYSNASVTTEKIANDAITGAKLGDDAVATANIGDGQVTAAKLAAGVGGKIVQVVINQKTAKFATNSTSYVDVTGYDCSITPSSSSNKILVITSANFGAGADGQNNYAKLLRGSTDLFTNDQSIRMPNAYHVNTFVALILDSPNTTSSTTYKYQVKAESNEVFLNRGGSNVTRGQSTILLIELDYT